METINKLTEPIIQELELMLMEKGYKTFSVHDADLHRTYEGTVSDVLRQFGKNSINTNLYHLSLETITDYNRETADCITCSFLLDLNTNTDAKIVDMGIHKHTQHFSVGKSFTVINTNDIPTITGANFAANQLFKIAKRIEKGITIS